MSCSALIKWQKKKIRLKIFESTFPIITRTFTCAPEAAWGGAGVAGRCGGCQSRASWLCATALWFHVEWSQGSHNVWRSLPGAEAAWGPGRGCAGGALGPGRSLCLTKSSACGRLWQFAHPRPLGLLQRGLAPRSKGKARAELRPARRQARGSYLP